MPRRKVPPENRKRSSHACQPCRSSKKKCDAGLPCSNCIQRNIQSLCTFSERNGHFYRHHTQPSLNASNGSFERQCELPGTGFTPPYPSTSDTNKATTSPLSESSASCEPDTEPTARILQNSDGERGSLSQLPRGRY
jgi:hypothetical protein